MPVGLVVVDAPAEPDHLLGAEVVEQRLLDLLARELGVAVGIEQALFGRHHGPLAVHVDRAALEHDRGAVAIGALDLEDLLRRPARRGPSGKYRPPSSPPQALKRQSTPRRPPPPSTHEGRARVAHPRVVGRDLDHADRGREHRAAVLELGVGDRHRHRLGDVDRLRHRRVGLLRGLGAAGASCPGAPARPSSSPRAARTPRACGSRRRRAWRRASRSRVGRQRAANDAPWRCADATAYSPRRWRRSA